MQSKRDGIKSTKRAWKRFENSCKLFAMLPKEERCIGTVDGIFVPILAYSDKALYDEYVTRANRAGLPLRRVQRGR